MPTREHTAADFLETSCQLAKPFDIFLGLFQATGGNPCTTGCAYFERGKCEAYRQLFRAGIKQ